MTSLQKWTLVAGEVTARYSVVLFFLGFGLAKFTHAEAVAVHPLLVHSPFLFWLPRLFDQQFSSEIIGVVEIALALSERCDRAAFAVSAAGDEMPSGSCSEHVRLARRGE
jgi:hypothetical protein